MTKSTRWDVGGNIIFHHPHEMNFASISVIDEASNQISVRTLNEKQLIEMQSAIREILSEFPKDP